MTSPTTSPAGTPKRITILDGDSNPLEVIGRATGVPGLVANRAPGIPDEWGLTHQRSGVALGWWTTDPELVIRFAHEIASVTDWTATGDTIRSIARAIAPKIHDAGRRLGLSTGGKRFADGPIADLNP